MMKLSRRKFFIGGCLLVAVGFFLFFFWSFKSPLPPVYGVTFSASYAEELKLDWRETYVAMFDELGVTHVRLSAYWDEIEKEKDVYDFSSLDWQINEAVKRGVKIILGVGRRLPRWPECHDPHWLSDLDEQSGEEALLKLITVVIERYKDNSAILYWQVENEPLLQWFGKCPEPDAALLQREVDVVRQLDPTRKIIVTDTGELSTWQTAAKYPDILGTTMYRVVWNRFFGITKYWFTPPAYYVIKAEAAKYRHANLEKVIVSELQMEPWSFNRPMTELSKIEREKSFDLEQFDKNIRYFQRTGFDEAYLWGVEYWYWLKVNGESEMWEKAKSLWQ